MWRERERKRERARESYIGSLNYITLRNAFEMSRFAKEEIRYASDDSLVI